VSQDGTSPGVPAADYPAFCRKLADELRQVPDLRTGQPLVSEVWTRDEVFQGPHGHVAPDLTLVLRDGGLVSILPSPEAVSRRPVVSGAHRYVGIFGARGPGIRRGLDARELSILDIAPTVLYSLGVPLPEDLQGRVPREIFQEGVLEKQPVRKVAAHAAETQATNHAPVSAEMEDEETVLDRLRELGYIE
jgi:predicted AlkP superfamily phosphohydrolase/phosphomutase